MKKYVALIVIIIGLIAFSISPSKEKRVLAAVVKRSVNIGCTNSMIDGPHSAAERNSTGKRVIVAAISDTASLALTIYDTCYRGVDYSDRSRENIFDVQMLKLNYIDSQGTSATIMEDSAYISNDGRAYYNLLSYLETPRNIHVLYTMSCYGGAALCMSTYDRINGRSMIRRWNMREYQEVDWDPPIVHNIKFGYLVQTELSDIPFIELDIDGRSGIWEIDGHELMSLNHIKPRFSIGYWIRRYLVM